MNEAQDPLGKPRVVITGLGMLSPVGLDAPTSWASLLAGVSGVAPITLFDPARIDATVAAELKGFDPESIVGKREARKLDRCSVAAIAAAREAWAMSGCTVDDPERVGVIIGSAFGGASTIQAGMGVLHERGPDRIGPHVLGAMLVDTPGFQVAHDLGVSAFGVERREKTALLQARQYFRGDATGNIDPAAREHRKRMVARHLSITVYE